MAKWLLMAADRLESPRFGITQEFLATLLGATRQTVTGVASTLHRNQVIDYTRGQLEILKSPPPRSRVMRVLSRVQAAAAASHNFTIHGDPALICQVPDRSGTAALVTLV